jgi:hypothetical protein
MAGSAAGIATTTVMEGGSGSSGQPLSEAHPQAESRRNPAAQTADKPVDFSAVFLFLGWTVTV